ncbi:MMPL family transporter [Rhizosaccharibacter radicis]|uniref:MMPL family transporter n=1 Tax=Rhizosaccharibacter radicis TaxID=2782605 RepID=A0ABT1W0F9_9PROT|nr:MMPL family transporter [Acetobacteraceae bacterium KSS12]
MLSVPLGRLAAFCSRRALMVSVLALLLAVGAVVATKTRLGVSTDTGGLFSAKLAWKKRQTMFKQAFPQGEDQLVAVIRAEIPEEAQATSRELAEALRATSHFRSVDLPGQDRYLRHNGLLFLDAKPLEALLEKTVDAQPFLGQLASDPSARGLFGALSLIGQGVARGQANLSSFAASLNGFADNLAQAAAGHPVPLSWQKLLSGSLSDMGGHYTFVVTQPKLDYGSFAPGGVATDAMRAAIAKLEFVRSGRAQVFITGSVALDDEEFATVAQGMVAGLIGSLVLVALWLILAVRTWRVIVPILLTLVLGLLLTTGFAALVVGTLNLISVAFAVLFVGIAVDFAIQFSVRFRAQRDAGGAVPAAGEALRMTGRETGVQILVAALATAAGFLAFTPTAFVGVAQLGLIAGFGMLIAFACTLTVLPALLTLFRPRPVHGEIGFTWARPLDRAVVRARRPILGISAVLALAGLCLIPSLRFDGDPLHTKNPNGEATRTLHLLMADPLTSPYSVELLAPNLDVARGLATRIGRLPLVHDVLWLGSFVPEDQGPKLEMIADAAQILLPTIEGQTVLPAPDAAALRAAAARTAADLAPVAAKLAPGDPLVRIAAAVTALKDAPDALLLDANAALTRFLPAQLDELRDVLSVNKPVGFDDVPAHIKRDWLLPDGRAHMEVHPRGGLNNNAKLHAFVRQVSAVWPELAGSAVTIVESARTVVHAFSVAALSALAAIAVILLVVLRRPKDMALVLAPLMLSALLTVLLLVAIPEPLNFANVIALPLLLGVGVSFNIYFVMNWRSGLDGPLASPTARAILFSALTTGTAFGSLAASHHPGTASMGRLLLLSLACTLLATLVFVPALLASVRRRTAG